MLVNVTTMISSEAQYIYDDQLLTVFSAEKRLVVLFLLTDRQLLMTTILVAWERNCIVKKAY